jgi:serine/threonine protein kinase
MASTDPVGQPAPSRCDPPSNREDETTVNLELAASPEPDDRGTFGDYVLLEQIARNAIGDVYLAQSQKLNRIVSIEILRTDPPFTADDVELSLRGARAAAALKHPIIVRIFDVGRHERRPYFAMDHVTGQPLAWAGRDNLLPRVGEHVLKIAHAVEYAHQQGVLHLSLSPHKVIVDASDQPHLFGFESAPRWTPPYSPEVMRSMGNPSYMSPEQVRDDPQQVGPATDVYGLGLILYELLTGHRPYSAQGGPEVIHQIIQAKPRSLRQSNPNVPPDLEVICLKCLEKDPKRRYPTAGKLAEDLGRFLYAPFVEPPVSWTRRATRRLLRRFGIRWWPLRR